MYYVEERARNQTKVSNDARIPATSAGMAEIAGMGGGEASEAVSMTAHGACARLITKLITCEAFPLVFISYLT